ncbi:hypothetical protein [Mycobacterium shigaense]|uniref:hypothetical protein n=1 Tax=Mycobacterium shigaense TaxID=722731 RepID=UPI0013C31593|nr:hypothetical protein [Mycobacterium shigaense]MEA1123905.1 hypothetical protein [Mycobacterium shigaense]
MPKLINAAIVAYLSFNLLNICGEVVRPVMPIRGGAARRPGMLGDSRSDPPIYPRVILG